MLARRYVEVDGLKIAYFDVGKGAPVLLVHGFASSSFTWTRLLPLLPKDRRYVALDLKGFGYSDKSLDGKFSPFYQAKLLANFAEKLDLRKVVLAGHSFGGSVALLALLATPFRKRVSKLVLIDAVVYPNPLPPFVRQLRIPLANNLVFSYVNSEILAKVILEETYFDKDKIDDEFVMEYASLMRLPGAVDCMIKSAERLSEGGGLAKRLGRVKMPSLVIWGENDGILPVLDAYRFLDDLPNVRLVVVPGCGHAPQEERPKDVAAAMSDFLNGRKVRALISKKDVGSGARPGVVEPVGSAAGERPAQRLRMSALIDRWSPTVFLMFVFIKALQLLNALGIRAKEGGWRKTMGAYLRTEHSKFALAVFGLDYLSDRPTLERLSEEDSRRHLIERLAAFLKESPSSHWKLRWDKFSVFRERRKFVDVVEVDFNDGRLTALRPHWDSSGPPFNKVDTKTEEAICAAIISEYNNTRNVRDEKRPILLRRNLRKWVSATIEGGKVAKEEAYSFVDRVLSGDWISFSILSGSDSSERFMVPDFIKHKHAGHGLLNILCRFSGERDEADFWFQFQHVPVDGVPMQEFLQGLKRRWGIRRRLVYPRSKPPREPVLQRCSTTRKERHALYQTSMFVDFRPLLDLRRGINAKCADEMGGAATVVSFVMWGLTMHPALKDRKFIFPVELAASEAMGMEREPSAIFIRPTEFVDPKNPIRGFFNFQYEFNRRMNATRARKSESYELIEIYAIVFPWLYTLTRKLMPRAVAEFTGTVGLTMIKDADMFITPLSDIQSDGFFAIGNLLVDTEDGGKAGCVSIRASKEKIPGYIEAFRNLHGNLRGFFENTDLLSKEGNGSGK